MAVPPSSPFVLLSNRGPVAFDLHPDGSLGSRRGAGGLVSGIGPLVAATQAPWIAAAISDGDRVAADSGLVDAEGYRVRLLSLDVEDYRLAYDVVSNEVLWFAHHGLWDLVREPMFDHRWPAAWDAYRRVNHAFAEAAAEIAPEGASVLVQDYHLCLVAPRLRVLRPDVRVVHFSHTPFAPPAWLTVIPEAAGVELVDGLAAAHACGFHTHHWERDFLACCEAAGISPPATFVAPLATDPDDIRAAAAGDATATALTRLDELVGDRALIARVDRAELSKNLVRGFLAYDELLASHPEHRERVVFVAAAYPSRQGVPAYAAYQADVERTVADVNARWGTPTWTPIVLATDDDFPRSVALLRRAEVLLVNPIRDGLNLVASEAALVNDRAAVLLLSPEAGAWEQLGPACLPAPPYDVAGTAASLHAALTMPMTERAERSEQLRALAAARTPADWLAAQLAAAG